MTSRMRINWWFSEASIILNVDSEEVQLGIDWSSQAWWQFTPFAGQSLYCMALRMASCELEYYTADWNLLRRGMTRRSIWAGISRIFIHTLGWSVAVITSSRCGSNCEDDPLESGCEVWRTRDRRVWEKWGFVPSQDISPSWKSNTSSDLNRWDGRKRGEMCISTNLWGLWKAEKMMWAGREVVLCAKHAQYGDVHRYTTLHYIQGH